MNTVPGPSGRGRGNASYIRKQLTSGKIRHLSLATGGQYKYLVVSRIIRYLKECFFEGRRRVPSLDQLLEQMKECQASDAIKEWLQCEGLRSHPRIRVLDGDVPRYAYEPPIPAEKCRSPGALLSYLKLLNETKTEAKGLLRRHVEESSSIADLIIRASVDKGDIIEVKCADGNRVLHYNVKHPQVSTLPEVDPRFLELWRKVNVSNKEMVQIEGHLERRGLLPTKSSSRKPGASHQAPEDPKKQYRRKVVYQENAHVKDLIVYDTDKLC